MHTRPKFKSMAIEDRPNRIIYWYPVAKSRSTKEHVYEQKQKQNRIGDNVWHTKRHSQVYPDLDWLFSTRS